ncbi:MAG: hypothetical protein JWP92_2981 [Caulobacter sp.]|nr:hypothetical protein [Caulobacter sp.]
MTRSIALIGRGLIAAAALAFTAGAAVADVPAKPAKPVRSCFQYSDWDGGWVAPQPDVIYLRVRMKDVYRLDLNNGSNLLTSPGVHLVSVVRGGGTVCSPIDLNLKVSDSSGIAIPLFVKAITKLTPEQVAALPKKSRP